MRLLGGICRQLSPVLHRQLNCGHPSLKTVKMKPVLYYDDRSPPVRSCLMLIKYLGIDVDLQFVDLFKQEHLAPDFVKLNPLHTVPTLKHENLILTDSHAILVYLAEKYGAGMDLYPRNESIRAQIINKLFFEACVLFRRTSDMMREIFHNRNGDKIDNHKEAIHEAYSFIETFLSADHDHHLAGPNMTIADISAVTTISSADLLFPITSEWPLLKKWFERMKLLPSYIHANEPGLAKIKEAIKSYANVDIEKRRQ